jgi:hypothetical protein
MDSGDSKHSTTIDSSTTDNVYDEATQMRILKQSTSVDVPIGPFVDETDGKTAETALTITQPDIRLKKNGGAWAQKNVAQTLSHEENGNYEVTLDATDTNTLGLLRLHVNEAGALPVWEDFLVVTANAFDSLCSTDLFQADVQQWLGATAPAAPATQASVNAIDDFLDTEIADIQARLPAGLVSGRIKAIVEAFAANAIDDAAVNSDMDSYTAKVWVIKDGTTADRYGVRWYKNGVPITSGITSPVIQVIKVSDGTDLIASTALTEIGSTHRFKRDETTNKMTAGQMYFAMVSATIDGSTRSFEQQIGRDAA